LELLANDLILAIGELAPAGVHLVAAKAGGAVAIKAATLRPDLVSSLTLAGTPVIGPDTRKSIEHIEQRGLESWVRETFDARFGTQLDSVAREWWIGLMSATPLSTIIGFLRFMASVDVTNLLPLLSCPTQILATDSRRRPLSEFIAWQRQIPGSSIVSVPGDGYHAAACDPEFCARATVAFLKGLS
jgi:pimeloyl-ACP methyl ester carboxylesterase